MININMPDDVHDVIAGDLFIGLSGNNFFSFVLSIDPFVTLDCDHGDLSFDKAYFRFYFGEWEKCD